MDYNTGKKKLILPEYGRNVQKLVEYATTIKDSKERNKMAKTIITIMGNKNPHLRDIIDFKHKLWDHLAIISEFKLDIDSPYETPKPTILTEKPKQIPYNYHEIKYKHYGRSIELLIDATIKLDEGEEKEILINIIANHMKKLYFTWNREMVNDDIIFKDLEELSNGKLNINRSLKLYDPKENISRIRKKKILRKK